MANRETGAPRQHCQGWYLPAGLSMDTYIPSGLGWHHDIPDFRDYGPHSPQVGEMLAGLPPTPPNISHVDLREYFSPVSDQQTLSASAAHACVALVEYFHRRAFGKNLEPSPLFLHQSAKQTGKMSGLPGLDLRSHMQAMVRFGIPPERQWPYAPQNAQLSPDARLYCFAETYRSILYVKLDARNGTGKDSLQIVKSFLSAGFPCAFGWSVPSSLSTDVDIDYRPTFDFVRGGQAVVAVGYDDNRRRSTRGALLVRSSWGTAWGERGYGWLPYAYVEEQLASCFWTLLRKEWIESGEFQRPILDGPSLSAP